MQDEKTEFNSGIQKKDYSEEILAAVKSNLTGAALSEKLSDYHENDIARVFGELEYSERRKLYEALDIPTLSDIFSYLDDVGKYVDELNNSKAADIIEEMDADDAVDVLEQLTEEKRDEIIGALDTDSKEDVKLIASFSDDMIGSRMTTNYIVVPKTFSVRQAMKSLVGQAAENDNVQKIFVCDENDRFYGAIDLRDLIVAREGQEIESIITTRYPYFYATDSIDDCMDDLKTYYEDALPILDSDNKIIGAITESDVVDAVQEEIVEDYAMFAGLTEAEDLNEPLLQSIKKRVPWLLVLLGLGLVVSSIMQGFQKFIPPTLIIIYTFQSLILDMSGNIGTQSLAVAIRVLSDIQLTAKQKAVFVLKEMKIGIANGFIIGLLAFGAIGCYLQFIAPSLIENLGVSGFAVSACIGISLIVAMFAASIVGTVVPIFFKKIKIDPAVASGPLITTVNDLVAVCTYYGFSILLFVKILHF